MIKEYSYGAVIYRIVNKNIEFLLEYMSLGHISIPKGHIEKGESIEDCVNREIREELGIKVDIDYKNSKVITYSPKEGIIKDVTFFIATNQKGDIKVDDYEVLEAKYHNLKEALELITFDSDKETIKWAYSIIEEKL